MNDKLKLLLQISSEIAKERKVKQMLIKLTEGIRKMLYSDRCSIFLHDKKNQELYTFIANGVSEIRIPDNIGIAGNVFNSGKILNIQDAYQDSRFDKEIDKKTGYRTKTILAIPLFDKSGQTMGVFQVINKLDSSDFSSEDIELLNHLALYAASSLENALLYEKLKSAHKDVVFRLSNATRFKDPETNFHTLRVGLYCGVLARHLGWDELEVETLELAAPMHDIGKVGIPDKILLKKGKLDDEEWKMMQKHAEYGYEILKNGESELLEMGALIALEHHEKWNGRGYPAGKKGEEISIYSRMTALADVFDALTSRRPYKEEWPLEKTLQLIESEKGEHFDPILCDLFLKNISEIVKIKETYEG